MGLDPTIKDNLTIGYLNELVNAESVNIKSSSSSFAINIIALDFLFRSSVTEKWGYIPREELSLLKGYMLSRNAFNKISFKSETLKEIDAIFSAIRPTADDVVFGIETLRLVSFFAVLSNLPEILCFTLITLYDILEEG